MALDGQADAGHAGHHAGVTRRHDRHLFGFDEATRGVHTGDLAALAANAGDLAVLDDVHTQGVSGARKAPSHGVVTRHTGAALQRSAEHGVAGVQVDEGDHLLDLFGCDHFGVHTVEAVGVDAALDVAHVLQGVAQVHDAALAEHDVVVDVLRQPFPQHHGFFVQGRGFVPQVVRAHDGGVARGVTAAQPTPLDDGDVAHAVLFGHVVGRGQTVAASPDHHRVVFALGLGRAPLAFPALVVRHAVAQQ